MKYLIFLVLLATSTYLILEFLNPNPVAESDFSEEILHRPKKKAHSPLKKPPLLRSKPLYVQKVKKKKDKQKINWDKTDTLEPVKNGHLIDSITIDGVEIVHGDILPPPSNLKIGKKTHLKRPRLWKNGIIPYTIDNGLPNTAAVKAAIAYINRETNVQFVKRNNHPDYVAIISGKEHCYSGVGRYGGKQFITLSPQCNRGAIIHELVHTIGLFHEQNRHDRNEFLEIYWSNIEPKFWPQFKKIPQSAMHAVDSPFNLKSIMLYPPNYFAKDKRFATMGTLDGELYTPETEKLNYWDIENINHLYP